MPILGLNSLFGLQGKKALITGASSGIGAEIAGALGGAGAEVCLLARRQEQLESLKAELAQSGIAAHILPCDLKAIGEEEWSPLVSTLRQNFGVVDILVNAAGVNYRQPWQEISQQSWEDTLRLNLSIPFFLARALVPGMIEKGYGKIINIASLQSERAFPNSMPYGASKGGIAQLTRAMSEAWGTQGIRANAIAPGFFPTELTAPVFGDAALSQQRAAQTCLKRNGELADLHGLSIFLAASASDYITGQVIYLDGGFTAQ